MNVERVLPAVPESVALARRFVVESLPTVPSERLDELALMVSELATNCVLHGGHEFHLRVKRVRKQVRVEVTDAGGGVPRMRRAATTEPHGRGLFIVDRLSDRWGVSPPSGRAGKTVWFTLTIV